MLESHGLSLTSVFTTCYFQHDFKWLFVCFYHDMNELDKPRTLQTILRSTWITKFRLIMINACSKVWILLNSYKIWAKGQLISKGLFAIFTWTKKWMKNFSISALKIYCSIILLLWVRAPLKEVFFLFNFFF